MQKIASLQKPCKRRSERSNWPLPKGSVGWQMRSKHDCNSTNRESPIGKSCIEEENESENQHIQMFSPGAELQHALGRQQSGARPISPRPALAQKLPAQIHLQSTRHPCSKSQIPHH